MIARQKLGAIGNRVRIETTPVLQYSLLLFLCFGLAPISAVGSIGVQDAAQYMSMEANGIRLSDIIAHFSEYDHRKPNEKGIRVIVVGCVHKPGVHYLSESATLEDVLTYAAPISSEEHPAKTYLRGVQIFRKNSKVIVADANTHSGKLLKLNEGDTILFRCVVL